MCKKRDNTTEKAGQRLATKTQRFTERLWAETHTQTNTQERTGTCAHTHTCTLLHHAQKHAHAMHTGAGTVKHTLPCPWVIAWLHLYNSYSWLHLHNPYS